MDRVPFLGLGVELPDGSRLRFLGIGGANFAVYSLWIPEQYGTECRVSAFAFTTTGLTSAELMPSNPQTRADS